MQNSARMITKIVLLFFMVSFLPAAGAMAESWEKIDDSSWCDEKSSFFSDSVCEVRELTVNENWKDISVKAAPNGGIRVEGWDKDSILIKARIQAKAGSRKKAEELMSEIDLYAGNGRIEADGPKWNFSNKSWSVSFRVMVPVKSNLELSSVNGGIKVKNALGEIEARTVNGGIDVEDLADDAEVSTVNGSINAEFDNDRWDKNEFEAKTTNGSIKVKLPEDCSAELKAGTVNGSINVDFPITVQGRIKKSIDTTLGGGGGDIELRTINGGIKISKK